MKSLPKLAVAVVLGLSSLAGAAYAAPATEPNSTFNFVPPQCELKATKTANPDWYRVGGYCNPFDSDSHGN